MTTEHNQLMPYQIEGVEFALKHTNALIADEMGLGKTVQAIGYINANPGINSALIICPLSLKINWQIEIKKWLTRECVIDILNYDRVGKTPISPMDLLIIDEAHFIKNSKSLRSKAVKAVAKIAKHVILLTGTPVENKPIELWPLLQVLNPKVWDPPGMVNKKQVGAGEGANFFTFAKRYCNARKVIHGKNGASHWDFSGASNLDELNDWLKKTGMIRRLKKDVLPQLPNKIRQVIELDTPKDLRDDEYYLGYLSDENAEAWEQTIKHLKSDKIAFEEWSKKRKEQGVRKAHCVAEHVTRCIEEGANKVILFAHHEEVITELSGQLIFEGIQYINSKMTAKERQDAVDVFNEDPNCKIIIGTIGTMGVGYTMTVSNLVVFAEIDPVPGKMAQAEDRAHRIGQKDSVLVHYLVFNKSIDARICKLLIKKQAVIDKIGVDK